MHFDQIDSQLLPFNSSPICSPKARILLISSSFPLPALFPLILLTAVPSSGVGLAPDS